VAAQRQATEGIASMDRPGVAGRALASIIGFVERLNLRYAVFGNPTIYDNATFPWVASIEREWQTIRGELDRVMLRKAGLPNMQDITSDATTITRDAGWKVFLLMAYGITSRPSIGLCPETWRIVRQIPGLKTALFSVFEPGKHLPPHRGPYNGVLRLHLGLIVPDTSDRVGIRVGTDVRHWQEGQVLIFDDAYEHETWNATDKARVVLFVDFVKPLRFPVNWLNALLLRLAVYTPYLREGSENLQHWERRFYGASAGR
jgi:aspartyl/asparaginyl beta-hydroxylase (cupin superfamily)